MENINLSKFYFCFVLLLVSCNSNKKELKNPVMEDYKLYICNTSFPGLEFFNPYIKFKVLFPEKYFKKSDTLIIDRSKFYYIDVIENKEGLDSTNGKDNYILTTTDNDYYIEFEILESDIKDIVKKYYYYLKFCQFYYDKDSIINVQNSFDVEVIPTYEFERDNAIIVEGNGD